jgi:hypothetical protein
MTKNISAALLLAASLSSCVVNVEDQMIDKEVHVNASQFNTLTFSGGDLAEKLVIRGKSMDTLSAFARASVWANNDEDARRIAEGMRLNWSGSTDAQLRIEYPGTEKEFVRVDKLSIDAPQRLGLNIDLSSADLDIQDMLGDVTVDLSSGDINLSTAGRVDIETSSGDVDVKTGKGGRIDVSSGDTRVDLTSRMFSDLHIESSSGDVIINIADSAGIDFELETSSGVIAINYGGFSSIDHEGTLTVRVNGGGKKVYVSSNSGDIHIGKL